MTFRDAALRLGDQARALDLEDCWRRLDAARIGRLVFLDGDQPVALPVNHVVQDASVAMRVVPGSKLAVAVLGGPVAFEVDDLTDDGRTGWSVLVKGRAELVDDREALDALFATHVRAWAVGSSSGTSWIRILADEVTGLEVGFPGEAT